MVNAEKGITTLVVEDGSSVACATLNQLDNPFNRAEVLDHKQKGPGSPTT